MARSRGFEEFMADDAFLRLITERVMRSATGEDTSEREELRRRMAGCDGRMYCVR